MDCSVFRAEEMGFPCYVYHAHGRISWGLFTLMPFLTLPNFGKVTKNMATFNLLPNFGNYIRNSAKILVSCQNLLRFFFGIKVNRPLIFVLM